MVTEWFLEVLAGFVTWFLDLWPDITLPTWVDDAAGYIAEGLTFFAGMSSVLPIGAMVSALAFLLAVSAVAIGIRVLRIIASFFTGGGGSAA